VITVLIIVIVRNVFCYLSNSKSPKNKLISNYVRKSSAWVNLWTCRYKL